MWSQRYWLIFIILSLPSSIIKNSTYFFIRSISSSSDWLLVGHQNGLQPGGEVPCSPAITRNHSGISCFDVMYVVFRFVSFCRCFNYVLLWYSYVLYVVFWWFFLFGLVYVIHFIMFWIFIMFFFACFLILLR